MDNWVETTIAIDFGSTNSAAYVCKGGYPTALANNDSSGEYQFPSFVEYTSDSVVVGLHAKRQFGKENKYVVACVKRLIGKTFDDYLAFQEKSIFGCEVIRGDDNSPRFVVSESGQSKTCEEVASEIFRKIKHDADAFTGKTCNYAYLTYPVDYNDIQKKAIEKACNMAGLKVKGWLQEPDAAALSWTLRSEFTGRGFERFVIFDFGGGTLDVSCLSCNNGVATFSHNVGNATLGGNDVDTVLMEYCVQIYKKENGKDLILGKDEKRRMKKLLKLRSMCEDVKRSLSSTQASEIDFSEITLHDEKPLTLTTTAFNRVIKNILDQCMKCVDEATKRDEWGPGTIRHVILVGGSSRICEIRNILRNKFVHADIPDITVVNPYSCVAEGACRKMMMDASGQIGNAMKTLNQSYGISGGDQVLLLLRKNMIVPCISATIRVQVTDPRADKLVTTVYAYSGDVNSQETRIMKQINECSEKGAISFDIPTSGNKYFELQMQMGFNETVQVTCRDIIRGELIGTQYLVIN